MRMRSKILSVSVAMVLLLVCSTAAFPGGGGVSGGATEVTQLANKAQLIEQLREEVEQKLELIKQYQNMLQNTLQLPQNIWNDVTGQFEELYGILEQAKSLTFGAAFDHEKCEAENPGYREDTGGLNYSEIYKDRVEDWQQYWEATLLANNMAAEEIKDSQGLIKQLNEAAKSSEGQHQALQAGNQIMVYQAQQLSQIHASILRQIDAQAEFAMNEQQERTDEEEAMGKAIGEWQQGSKPDNLRKRGF